MIRSVSMNQPTYKIRLIGGTLAVTLPQHIVKFAQLKAGDPVTIVCQKDGLIRIQKSGTHKSGDKK